MARRFTYGAELNDFAGGLVEPSTGGGAAPTIVTSPVRSGARAFSCASGAGNATSFLSLGLTPLATTSYFFRACLHVPTGSLPGSAVDVFRTDGGSTSVGYIVRLTAAGKLQLIRNGTQVGADSAALPLDSFENRVEVTLTSNGTNWTGAELRLNGDTVATDSGQTLTGAAASAAWGWITAPGASKTLYLDDLACNDGAGADQNTWAGEGKVVLLVPASDNAVGSGWQKPGGATTGLSTSVDNEPPVGVADSTSAADAEKLIRNATSTATANYDANVTDYLTAGVGPLDVVKLVQWVVNHGSASNSSPPARAAQLVSNPAEGAETALTAQGAVATYPSGWLWERGAYAYNPAVTLATAPVLRVGKRTASTRIVDVDSMAVVVEYQRHARPRPVVFGLNELARRPLEMAFGPPGSL